MIPFREVYGARAMPKFKGVSNCDASDAGCWTILQKRSLGMGQGVLGLPKTGTLPEEEKCPRQAAR